MSKIAEIERCDYLQERFDIVKGNRYTVPPGTDVHRECLRPKGHEGPHLIINHWG